MEIPSPTDTNITYFDTTDSEDHKNSDNESHEFSYNPSQGIQVPEPNDIVCGRGKFTVDHPGNRRFRRLIWEKKDDYQKATRRDDKTRITHELVRKLRSGTDAGRFLLYDPNTKLWYDTGDEYAREKVSHSLRSRPNGHRRSKPKPKKKPLQKPQVPPGLDSLVRRLLKDQQALLKRMIEQQSTSAY